MQINDQNVLYWTISVTNLFAPVHGRQNFDLIICLHVRKGRSQRSISSTPAKCIAMTFLDTLSKLVLKMISLKLGGDERVRKKPR